jgi:hypothetical protein
MVEALVLSLSWLPKYQTNSVTLRKIGSLEDNIRVPLLTDLCKQKKQPAALSDLWGCSEIEADLKVTNSEGEEKNDTLITNATENGRYAVSLVSTESLNIVQRHPNDTTRLIPHQ